MAQERKDRRPILVNGEYYVSPVEKKHPPITTKYPRTYEEARELLRQDLKATKQQLGHLPKSKRVETAVFCLRLNPKFIAKTHYPDAIFEETPLTPIGSRRWQIPDSDTPKKTPKKKNILTYSKLIFARASETSLDDFLGQLNRSTQSLSQKWMGDIQKLEHISLLDSQEQLLGFSEDWKNGWVEMVLHPLGGDSERAREKLLTLLSSGGVNTEQVRSAVYAHGLTFLAAKLSRKQLELLRDFNPLRTAHPMANIELPNFRSSNDIAAPSPPASTSVSSIKVGMFDGGSDGDLALLKDHVTCEDLVSTLATDRGVAHGSAVAGSILYGPLNSYGNGAILPNPPVAVVSYRVMPQSSPRDFDMYEVIDKIEEVVPQNQDIRVYNLSLGPNGPILDDIISRFTTVLDHLSYSHKILFVVAAGNDGAEPLNRIQSPSDTVNGLGIGAWTYKKAGSPDRVRAPYSCIGPGREGSKLKPDVAAFGGCPNSPIHLVGTKEGFLSSAWGTSIAAPLASRLVAELLGRSNNLSTLMGKVLAIHSAKHPNGLPDFDLGHGCLPESVDELVHCDKNRVTVLFQGALRAGKYAKLPIPMPEIDPVTNTGPIRFSWTVGLLTKPDVLNADEYCSMGIEDIFYPNSQKFGFYKKGKSGKFSHRSIDLRIEPAMEAKLLEAGWTKPKFPMSGSGNLYKANEFDRRVNYKWDTVVQRQVSVSARNVCEPFMVLHAMGRNEHDPDDDPVHYAVAVTIDFPKYKGDLYNDTIKQFSQLQPIRVKAVNEILVSVGNSG